jgi:L-fuculose-phosphate aldolase
VLALRNHGIVAVGRTVREAVCAAVIYEENAAMQLMALAAGGVQSLPEAQAAEARDFLWRPRVVDMRWRQLARTAARTRPFLLAAA